MPPLCETPLVSDGTARLTEVRHALSAAGLSRHADSLTQRALPSVRLVGDAQIDVSAPGASRIGGLPELPPEVAWPSKAGAPLSFIAQLNLADLSVHDTEGLLPREGLLSFFYDAVSQQAWGFDPADRGSWAVMHTSASEVVALRDAPADLPADGQFPPLGLEAHSELTFPPGESFIVETLGLSFDERATYSEVLPDAEDVTAHRLLGHPEPIQGDMQLECQLVSHGLYCGDPSGYEEERAAPLAPGALDWRLLLQVDTEDENGMMWGDCGRLYFWIRHEDLVAGRWDGAWCVLQCY